jgi:hypothetical protein
MSNANSDQPSTAKSNPRTWLAGLLAASILLAGCSDGPETGEVVGTVKVDGQTPAAGSSITFIPADGKTPSSGALIVDGRYSARVPVGVSKVEIRVPRPMKVSGKAGAGPGPGGDRVEESLPAKYNDKTELTLDVQKGKNEKDWDLPGN